MDTQKLREFRPIRLSLGPSASQTRHNLFKGNLQSRVALLLHVTAALSVTHACLTMQFVFFCAQLSSSLILFVRFELGC